MQQPALPLFLGLILFLVAASASATGLAQREPLQLASVHAAAGYLDTEETLHTKRAEIPVPIASLTKVMTAIVVLDSGEPLDEWLEIVERDHAVSKNAYSRMRIGSELTRGELLRLALMSSENLATHVLASHHPGGRDAFIAAMNAKAQELGMHNTRFVDSSGLSTKNVSTASDLLKMVRAAHAYGEIGLFSTTAHRTAQFRAPRYTLGYGNTNSLVSNPGWSVVLSKTGYLDEAGRCLVMVAELEGRPVAMVFLNSRGTRSPLGDAGRLRRWLATGEGGTVAQSAREYEQQRASELGSGG